MVQKRDVALVTQRNARNRSAHTLASRGVALAADESGGGECRVATLRDTPGSLPATGIETSL